jgi:hypothetical protein
MWRSTYSLLNGDRYFRGCYFLHHQVDEFRAINPEVTNLKLLAVKTSNLNKLLSAQLVVVSVSFNNTRNKRERIKRLLWNLIEFITTLRWLYFIPRIVQEEAVLRATKAIGRLFPTGSQSQWCGTGIPTNLALRSSRNFDVHTPVVFLHTRFFDTTGFYKQPDVSKQHPATHHSCTAA